MVTLLQHHATDIACGMINGEPSSVLVSKQDKVIKCDLTSLGHHLLVLMHAVANVCCMSRRMKLQKPNPSLAAWAASSSDACCQQHVLSPWQQGSL